MERATFHWLRFFVFRGAQNSLHNSGFTLVVPGFEFDSGASMRCSTKALVHFAKGCEDFNFLPTDWVFRIKPLTVSHF